MSEPSRSPPKDQDPYLGLLVEALKSVNKDTLGQFGSTRSVHGAPIQGTLMAYAALDEVAEGIAAKVKEAAESNKVEVVLVQPGEDMSDLAEYRGMLARLDALGTQLDTEAKEAEEALEQAATKAPVGPPESFALISPAVAAALAPVAGPAAAAAISLLGLFTRTSTTEQHGNVAIADADLVAAVAQKLRGKGIGAVLPASVALSADGNAGAATRLMARLSDLHGKARALRVLLARIEARLPPKPEGAVAKAAPSEAAKDLIAQLGVIQGTKGDPPEPASAAGPGGTAGDAAATDAEKDLIAQIDAALSAAPDPASVAEAAQTLRLRAAKLNIEAAQRAFETVWSALPAVLPRLLRGDAAEHRLGDKGAILALRVVVAGGSTRSETSAAPWKATVIENSGGVLASFTFFDPKGQVLASDRVEKILVDRRKAP